MSKFVYRRAIFKSPEAVTNVIVQADGDPNQRITIISPQSQLVEFHSSNQTQGYNRRTARSGDVMEIVNIGQGAVGHPGSITIIDPSSSNPDASNVTQGYGRRTARSDDTTEIVNIGSGAVGHPGAITLSTTYV